MYASHPTRPNMSNYAILYNSYLSFHPMIHCKHKHPHTDLVLGGCSHVVYFPHPWSKIKVMAHQSKMQPVFNRWTRCTAAEHPSIPLRYIKFMMSLLVENDYDWNASEGGAQVVWCTSDPSTKIAALYSGVSPLSFLTVTNVCRYFTMVRFPVYASPNETTQDLKIN